MNETQTNPKPDLLAQAGELLQLHAAGRAVSGSLNQQRNSTLVLASCLLAIASELRDIDNTLNDIADRLPPTWMRQ
jgi:hypothetical protein